MSVVLLVIFATLLGALCYKWYHFNKLVEQLGWIRQPKGWPLIGHVLEFKDSTTMLNDLARLHKQLGTKLILVNFGLSTNIVCMDYDFTEFLLTTQDILNKGDDYKFLHQWIGTGLLTSDGPKWKKRRRLITPAFHFSILEEFIESFELNGKVLVQKLKNVTGKYIDIHRYITLYALDVICDAAMGVTKNAQNDEDSQYVRDVKFLLKILSERAISVLKGNDLLFPLFPDFYKVKRAVKHLHSVTYSVIDSRRDALNQVEKNKDIMKNGTGKKKMAFLDILLKSTVEGKPLSRDDIREEVDTFMFEGHDTTSSGMGFALYLLATHQDVQKQAVEEQKQIFENDIFRNITYNDLQKMKYLECIIKEALRLYPSVPLYARHTTVDVPYKGNVIPKGADIIVFAYGILRDPDYFPDPEKFDPSRFENSDGTKPYSYIPFSAGPRNCIGQKFAMLEMKSTLSKILRNFELYPTNPEHKLILASEAVLKSVNGIRIQIAERK
ncbi:unnamed protein product [Acanthoscelides obtectus]|uniref:Cytochrome P450 n=1 Tax=Acanthoscelides obtectus TaxID=200917 RepID=A0A9P0JXE2_ACAOB|nr:unnamed protein product [Acanthoscelides obtectus]CAK1653079.1 Probable cytochrome P450 4d14 [Acanthoscelides obtectus]